MTFRRALRELARLSRFGVRPGLGRIEALLSRLGTPQNGFFVVHVAGTNGKGSVCALVFSALRAQGYRAGLYTSPHLLSVRERIRLGGGLISRADFARGLSRVLAAARCLRPAPTYFEVLTALALDFFSRRKARIVVLETGLGGRLDATNAVPSLVQVLTPIGLDHTLQLGKTLRAVAREKAGIIKPGSLVLTRQTSPAALSVIRQACRRRGARLVVPPEKTFAGLVLEGQHQNINASLALSALGAVREKYGLPCPAAAFSRALKTVLWPARFQILRHGPRRVVIDGAHNPHAARALASALRLKFPGEKFLLVAGFSADKDFSRVLGILRPLCSGAVFCGTKNPRTIAPGLLLRRFGKKFRAAGVAPEAAAVLRTELFRESPLVLVAGSLFLAAEWLALAAQRRSGMRFERQDAQTRAFLREGLGDLALCPLRAQENPAAR